MSNLKQPWAEDPTTRADWHQLPTLRTHQVILPNTAPRTRRLEDRKPKLENPENGKV